MKKMVQIWLCFLLTVLFTLAMPLSAAAKTFPDVPRKEWFFKPVYYSSEKGYMAGEGDGFHPDGTVTRAQITQVLYNREGKPAVDLTQNPFTDVRSGWYVNSVVWSRENGVVLGDTPTSFRPLGFVTREQVCVMAYNYCVKYLGNPSVLASEDFMAKYQDWNKVSGYAKEAIRWAVQTGFMGGTSDTTLDPKARASRKELAQFLMNLDKVLGDQTEMEYPPEEEPEEPDGAYKAPVKFSKTVAGCSVTGVEFDPRNGYTARLSLANGRLRTTQSVGGLIGSNAVVAVNGTFFNRGSDNSTSGVLINNGQILQDYVEGAPNKPAFVIDGDGKASIEFFQIFRGMQLLRNGEVIKTYAGEENPVRTNMIVSENAARADGTKMVATRAFANSISGKVLTAAAVDGSGKVTAVYQNKTGVAIPASGYLLYERFKRSKYDTFMDEIQVGDTIELSTSYKGSRTQDISVAVSCGPTVVKNGKAYGNSATYRAEGFTDPHVLEGASPRMAIGVKKDGTVVIVNTSCSLSALSKVMLGLGCETAMNLDGGASTTLYDRGSYLASPGTQLTNVLVFEKKR